MAGLCRGTAGTGDAQEKHQSRLIQRFTSTAAEDTGVPEPLTS